MKPQYFLWIGFVFFLATALVSAVRFDGVALVEDLKNEAGDLVLRSDKGSESLRIVPSVIYEGVEREVSMLTLTLPSLSTSYLNKRIGGGWKFSYLISGVNSLEANNFDSIIWRINGSKAAYWEDSINEDNSSVKRIYYANNYYLDFKDLTDSGIIVKFYPEINQVYLLNLSSVYKAGTFFLDPTLQSTCATLSINDERYEVTANLTSAGTCLLVSGNNVTVDGSGYNISFANESNINSHGIQITGTNVTITNFSGITLINNSNTGTDAIRTSASNTTIKNNILNYNANSVNTNVQIAVNLLGSNFSSITDNDITGATRGAQQGVVRLTDSHHVLVSRNKIVSTTSTSVAFIFNAPGHNVTLQNNHIRSADSTVSLETAGNTIDRNNMSTSGTANVLALAASTADSNMISNNNMTGTGTSAVISFQTNANINFNIFANNTLRTTSTSSPVIILANAGNNATLNNFTNNILNSSANLWFSTFPQPYFFNNYSLNTITTGINIVGGANLGGNFYTNTTRTGFSDTCADANSDGICDGNLTFGNANQTDFFPLATPSGIIASEFAGNATIIFPANLVSLTTSNFSLNYSDNDSTTTTPTFYVYLNGSFNKSLSNINTTLRLNDGDWAINVSLNNGSVWTRNDSRTVNINNATPQTLGNVTILLPVANDILNRSNNSINYTINGTNIFTYTFFIYLNGSLNQSSRPANTTLNLSDGDYTINVSAFNTTHFTANTTRTYQVRNTSAAFSPDLNGTLLLTLNNGGINVTQNNTFTINASVTCSGGSGDCYQINGTAYYNLTSFVMTPINDTSLAVPFFNVTGFQNQTCSDFLNQGQTCSVNWTVNATGRIGTNWLITINVSSNNSVISVNGSSRFGVNISDFISVVGDSIPPSFYNNGTNTTTARINQIIQFSINTSDNSQLAYIIFESNYSGVKANETFTVSGAKYNLTINKTYLLTSGRPPAFKWYILDASGNVNSTVEQTLSMCIETWSCTGWVQNGSTEYRSCTDAAGCATVEIKPKTERTFSEFWPAIALIFAALMIFTFKTSMKLDEKEHWQLRMGLFYGTLILGWASLGGFINMAVANNVSANLMRSIIVIYEAYTTLSVLCFIYLGVKMFIYIFNSWKMIHGKQERKVW